MIEHLRIKNVALIESAELTFGHGLNILSGETGAGKSMVIDAINFMLGERCGKDFIRHGAELASVEGEIYLSNAALKKAVGEYGIDIDDDGLIILYRALGITGKSSCRINGRAVTISQLREVSALLVDVHGQHEHQSLLNPGRHIQLLDRFCGENIEAYRAELAEVLKSYKDVTKRIADLCGPEKALAAKVEILEMQKNEIESVNLPGMDEEALTERRDMLLSAEKLNDHTSSALELLSGGESEQIPAMDAIVRAIAHFNAIADIIPKHRTLADAMETIASQLEDVIADLRHFYYTLERDPGELAAIDDRLNDIFNLKRKYGGSIEEVLNRYDEICGELDTIENNGKLLKELNVLQKKYAVELNAVCRKMTELRTASAQEIKMRIIDVLHELGMKNAEFDVSIEHKKEISSSGNDKIEFMISTNLGEGLKPLAKIASGGEMSRVMLALKTVLADVDNIETFIFDEIDSGVSGRTAQQVAEKLSFIGRNHQILCITHLPQIAAMGDHHFLIEKKSDEYTTRTDVFKLEYEKSVQELARLIGGAKITDATLLAANELKQQAAQLILGGGV